MTTGATTGTTTETITATTDAAPGASGERGDPLLQVDDLRVVFSLRKGFFQRVPLVAVRDVSLHISRGETLGLVGESGSGKSTTGRAILRLIEPEQGKVLLGGRDLTAVPRKQLRLARRDMQMVFQDPYSSLDPSMTIGDSIGEPLEIHDGLKGRERDDRVADLLQRVGLSPEHMERYPYEFSGGQRQRIAIARAVAVRPQLLICDEAVSALDVSTQNQVINLLEELREQFGMAYLFIAHDLAVVRHLSHRVAVMYLGTIVEEGPTDRVYHSPVHPYTHALLSAVPIPDPVRQAEKERIILTGDMPDPTSPPSGCPFHTRCAHVMDICRSEMPPVTPVDGGGSVRCFLHTPTSPTSPAPAPATATEIGVSLP